jgi:hypothetical protein
MAIKRSRRDCAIHGPRPVAAFTQGWLQARITRGQSTWQTPVTIFRPLVFRQGSGHLLDCTITALFEGVAYMYYDTVRGFLPENDPNIADLCGLAESGTIFIRANERLMFLRPVQHAPLRTLVFDPNRRIR